MGEHLLACIRQMIMTSFAARRKPNKTFTCPKKPPSVCIFLCIDFLQGYRVSLCPSRQKSDNSDTYRGTRFPQSKTSRAANPFFTSNSQDPHDRQRHLPAPPGNAPSDPNPYTAAQPPTIPTRSKSHADKTPMPPVPAPAHAGYAPADGSRSVYSTTAPRSPQAVSSLAQPYHQTDSHLPFSYRETDSFPGTSGSAAASGSLQRRAPREPATRGIRRRRYWVSAAETHPHRYQNHSQSITTRK